MSSDNEGTLIDLTQEIVSIAQTRSNTISPHPQQRSSFQLGLGLWRFRFTIVSAVIVGIGGAIGFFSINPRLYKSTALVSLGHSGSNGKRDRHLGISRVDEIALPHEAKIALAKSYSLAGRVLDQNPDISTLFPRSLAVPLPEKNRESAPIGAPGTTSSLAEITGYLSRISYAYSKEANLIAISAIATDPVAAAKVANTHSQALIDLIYEKQASQAEAVLADNKHAEEDTRNSYFLLVEQDQSLEEQLKKTSHDQPEKVKLESELKVVKRSLEFAKASWEASKEKLLYAAHLKSEPNGMTIIDPAVTPLSPITLGLLPLVSIGGLIGGLLGGILALIRESRDSSLHSVHACTSQLGHPLIGMIPTLSSDTKHATALMAARLSNPEGKRTSESSTSITSWFRYHVSSEKPRAPLLLAAPFCAESEAIRAMATSLAHRCLYGQQKIILFTSPGPREGKSLLAVNTAIALAQMHKRTLLVDADLRFPSIHRYFGFHRESVGLFDFSLGVSEINDLILESSTEGLLLLLSGSPAPLPTLITDHASIERGIRSLSPLFDVIIVDSPSIGSVVDPLILSRIAHSVVLVTRFNQTTIREAQVALDQLNQVNANVIGIALNDIKDEPLLRYLNN